MIPPNCLAWHTLFSKISLYNPSQGKNQKLLSGQSKFIHQLLQPLNNNPQDIHLLHHILNLNQPKLKTKNPCTNTVLKNLRPFHPLNLSVLPLLLMGIFRLLSLRQNLQSRLVTLKKLMQTKPAHPESYFEMTYSCHWKWHTRRPAQLPFSIKPPTSTT